MKHLLLVAHIPSTNTSAMRDAVAAGVLSPEVDSVELRSLTPFEYGKHKLGHLQAILDQDYRGNITVVPKLRARDYWGLFSNPTRRVVDALILEGQRATWPKIPMIRNQTRISQTLERCLAQLRAQQAARTNGQVSLRLVRQNSA